ncbi:MobP3 family relaxase [Ruminococcus bicirculans (ex Wegman et al. 2014)]|jgi:TPR repeat protein|uniref:MobP3 family relaxase n=1 Tax=Ruminococcus bicirculans (ex Wegman et al. 2014) TaxID=1160721 RepID=UPI00307C9F89
MTLSQIIVTSRYLKSGTQKSKNKRRNYTKYIATRETVEVRDQNIMDRNDNATKNQEQLLNDLLSDFPEAKKYLEYEDYTVNPTVENASELISTIIERNADVIGNRQNFVGYMAMRPGVQKRGSHGLFNEKDEPIILDRVANEIANHKGNVWSHVISLRREDAIRLGYDNSEAWRQLVMRHISDIAKNQKISLCNLKWYAAFHDTTHHPHIHLLVYSENTKEGFLTNEGINKIRSAFANDIFKDDLQSIYQEQTLSRDELKAVSKTEFKSIVRKVQQGGFENPQLENLIRKLYSQLQNVKGKKVYGYLPPDVKETVNSIFSELAKDNNIRQLYEKWCSLESLKYKSYTQKEKELPPLVDNKVFQPVRNMIIRTVLDMNYPVIDVEIEEPEPTEQFANDDFYVDILLKFDESEQSENDKVTFSDNDEPTAEDFIWSNENEVTVDIEDYEPQSKYYLKWSTAYKEACKIIYNKQSKLEDFKKAEQLLLSESKSGNVLAIHDLGKLYSTDKLGAKDEEKSFAFYQEALQGFMEIEPDSDYMFPYEPKFKGQVMKPADMRSYVWYRIGKMHCYGLGTEQDYEKAFQWFLKSSQEGHKFAQYSLANLYYYGNGVEKDLSQAFLWYQKSASQGQPYASYAAAQMYSKGEYVAENKETAQRYYKAALSGFLELESKDQADDNLFYKIGVMYKNGLGTEADISKAIDYFKRSAEMNNKNGLYEYGKALIQGNHIEADLEKGLECVEKAMKLKNSNAKRFFALEYISGEHFSQDIEKGLFMLTECADKGDSFACFQLGQFYLKGEIVTQDLERAEKYLLLAEDNEFTQYAFGKLYLQEEKYDIQKAVDYFEKSADKNMWSSYQLGRLYLFGADELEKDKEKAVEWLTKSANDGNEYVQNMLNNIDDFENMLLRNTVMGLFVNLSRCIEDNYSQKQCSLKIQTDRKLRKMIQKRKSGIGIREEQNMTN